MRERRGVSEEILVVVSDGGRISRGRDNVHKTVDIAV